MAYTHKGPKPDGGFFYNVEQAVGATGVNNSGDVKLVQYMIKNIYGAQAAGLAVDGWIGPTTITWIKKFQTDAKAQGSNILSDGRVDRALALISSVSKTTYAIMVMNRMLKAANPGAYAALPSAVPLSAVPKANPYNPKAKTVVETIRKYTTKGWEITTVFDDGTKSTCIVTGNLVVAGQIYHGKVIHRWLVPAPVNTAPPASKLISAQIMNWYEDHYVEYLDGFYMPASAA